MSSTDTPLLELEHFSGPIDVLLERVRAQQLDLTRFSMREILNQFGTALEAAIGSRTLAELGDWVVMAAWLVLLRTRLMLPANEPGRVEAEQVAAALRSKVLRREQIARATDWLEERPRLGRDVSGGLACATGSSQGAAATRRTCSGRAWPCCANGRGGRNSTAVCRDRPSGPCTMLCSG